MEPTNISKKLEIVNLINKSLQISQICKQLKCGRKTVEKVALEYNLQITKPKHLEPDDDFFKIIVTELKSYILGIIYSRGSICSTRNFISFNFDSSDAESLELISESIYHQNLVKIKPSKLCSSGAYAIFNIYSKEIKNDLLKLGGGLIKDEYKCPILNDDLFFHFLRGYFEGRGFLSFDAHCYFIQLSGNHYLLNSIQEKLNNCNITSNINDKLKIYGKDNVYKFLKLIYQNHQFKLKNKYDKYQEFLKVAHLNEIGNETNYMTKNQARLITLDIEVVHFYNQGYSSRQIAKELGVARCTILHSYQRVGFAGLKRNTKKICYLKERECKKCHEQKPLDNFNSAIKRKYRVWNTLCKPCEKETNSINNKISYQKNKKWHKNYKLKNRNKLKESYRKRWQNDIQFKLRKTVSRSIKYYLLHHNGHKNGLSCLEFLPFTIQELKDHLEKQFEPWMNWNNWGIYDQNIWNDNDVLTWKWQIDHIIPHSLFKYSSMEDDSFKKCWSLDNLRPLSAKQNFIDGTQRTRHI